LRETRGRDPPPRGVPEDFISAIAESSDSTAVYPGTGTQTASYNDLNQLTALSGQALGYDANGNLTSDGQRTYSWDAENRLVGIAYPGNNSGDIIRNSRREFPGHNRFDLARLTVFNKGEAQLASGLRTKDELYSSGRTRAAGGRRVPSTFARPFRGPL
jgi:YD repeat-containing protein